MKTKYKDCIIVVDGETVGYQFNKKSMGTRSFRKRTVIEENGSTSVYIPLLQRYIKVRKVVSYSSRLWEACK